MRESDGGTRQRYRGRGKRGKPSRAQDASLDLRLATVELEGARQQLAAAYALPKVDKNGQVQRREAIKTAIGKLLLVGRLLDDVCMRAGFEPCDC